MAYAKVGFFGFQGSGKTHTAMGIAFGICEAIGANRIAFFDTETGSDWWVARMPAVVELLVVKSRSFDDLCAVIQECEQEVIPVLIIDSITHVWRDLIESYTRKLHRKRLEFQDWNIVKGEWGRYTDLFINSRVHIMVCGRAGYEYDFDYNEDGTKDLIKTGTKMKSESEFGFEPSLVIEMERMSEARQEIENITDRRKKQAHKPKIGSKWIHRAHVLKDRADKINGETFDNPTFDNFQPHFAALNIGGEHLGVDTSRTSEHLFDTGGDTAWKKKQIKRKIALETVQETLTKLWPSTNASDKAAKRHMVELIFATVSWTDVENRPLNDLEQAAQRVKDFAIMLPSYNADDFDTIEQMTTRVWEDVIAAEAQPPEHVEQVADVPY